MATQREEVYQSAEFVPVNPDFALSCRSDDQVIIGWNTLERRDDVTNFPQYKSNPESIPGFSDDTDLYATWGYEVTIDKSNPHGFATVSPDHSVGFDVKKFLPGENVQFNANIQNGYKFKQWGDGSTICPRTKTINSNFKESLQTEIIPYTISYNMDGGENNPENPSQYNVESETITLKNPTKDNYNFLYWTPSDTIPTGSFGNKTFTANWKIKELHVVNLIDSGQTTTVTVPGKLHVYLTGSNGEVSYTYKYYHSGYGRYYTVTETYWYTMGRIQIYKNGTCLHNVTNFQYINNLIDVVPGDTIKLIVTLYLYGRAYEYETGWDPWIHRGTGTYSLPSSIGTITYSYYQ